MRPLTRRTRRIAAAVALAIVPAVPLGTSLLASAPAGATACSLASGNASCTISTSVTVSAGTLTLESSPNLYWSYVLNGYDQWASGSSATLSGCTAGGSGTTCSGGAAPRLEVVDATGSGSGWALSAYLTANDLPVGSVFHFAGAGSATVGNSQNAAIGTDPFANTTPGTVCDFGSTCTVPTAPGACSHAGLGFTSCPTYPVNMSAGTGPTAQVDLYSAAATSGLGAVCFGSGSASASGCTGTTPSDFYNIGVKANTAAAVDATTVVTETVSSGP